MINQGIANFYARLDDPEKPPQKPVTRIEADEFNYMSNIVFGPAAVIVNSNAANTKSVDLRLLLKSGSLKLNNSVLINEDEGIRRRREWTMEISNWTIAVPVDISEVPLLCQISR